MTNASPILRMKRHDTAPALTIHLTDNGTPVDLTTATGIKVLGSHDTDLNVHFARVVTGDVNGLVMMNWQASDTAVPGLLNIEVEVTNADNTVQSYPGSGYLRVIVEDDLG